MTVLRKLRPEDLPAVLAILEHWNMAPVAASAQVPEPERTALEPQTAFVALQDGAPVGVGSYWMRGDLGVTGVLAVHPDWQRRGIGRALHAARVEEMRRLGARKVRIEADRPDSIAWYQQSFGCRLTGTVEKKHAFGLADADHWTVLEQDLA